MMPLSPLIGLGTYAIKQWMQSRADQQEREHQEHIRSMASFSAEEDSRVRAQQMDSKEVSFARRTAFIIFTLGIVLPVFAPLVGVQTAIAWHEVNPGFLWMDDVETVRWAVIGDTTLAAMVVPPIIYDLYAMMVGFYYGGRKDKR